MNKGTLLTFMLALATTTNATETHIRSYVPLDKERSPEYIESLYNKGETKVYSNESIKYVAMPCGGIGAGEVNIQGTGEFCFYSDVFNKLRMYNGGREGSKYSNGYQYLHPTIDKSLIENKFLIAILNEDGTQEVYPLNNEGFDNMGFIGEYPVAKLTYKDSTHKLPIEISSEVFTSYVPSSVRKSANPMVMMKVTLQNHSNRRVTTSLAGWMRGLEFSNTDGVKYQNQPYVGRNIRAISYTMQPINGDEHTKEVLEDSQLGSLSLAILGKSGEVVTNCAESHNIFDANSDTESSQLSNTPQGGGVVETLSLKPGEKKSVTFAISWYFPNKYEYFARGLRLNALPEAPGWVGHIYNNWYDSSLDVVKYCADNKENIYDETMLFHDTYFNNTIPYWLSNRITMSLSTLTAGNISIWKNGRLYAYEGIGFCAGTCGHVYNFVPTIAQLFPELERSIRTMQDFNPEVSYDKSGRINFRGHITGLDHRWASDAQSGYILKSYREHLMSKDNSFLESIWDKVKMAMTYQIFKDGAEIGLRPNGVLECEQTFWDPMWYGPNPYNQSLYLAALRAAEKMAIVMGEQELADRYHSLFVEGREYMSNEMWNGEYYIHLYPNGMLGNQGMYNGSKTPEEIDEQAESYGKAFNDGAPTYFKSTACDATQLFGQNWADQLGMGDILPSEMNKTAMSSVYKYNFTPDIATVYSFTKPRTRILADSGEAAMVNGSWPKIAPKEFENTHDKSDIWTGLEYDAACNMINLSLLDEALVVIKAIDDRYDGAKRNPWNEVEGSDHYSRAMQAWNILRSLSGQSYDGPKGILRFDPKLNPEKFRSFFTVAEGWGSYSQECNENKATYALDLKYGTLRLKELSLQRIDDSMNYMCSLNGRDIAITYNNVDDKVIIDLPVLNIKAGDMLVITAN